MLFENEGENKSIPIFNKIGTVFHFFSGSFAIISVNFGNIQLKSNVLNLKKLRAYLFCIPILISITYIEVIFEAKTEKKHTKRNLLKMVHLADTMFLKVF